MASQRFHKYLPFPLPGPVICARPGLNMNWVTHLPRIFLIYVSLVSPWNFASCDLTLTDLLLPSYHHVTVRNTTTTTTEMAETSVMEVSGDGDQTDLSLDLLTPSYPKSLHSVTTEGMSSYFMNYTQNLFLRISS